MIEEVNIVGVEELLDRFKKGESTVDLFMRPVMVRLLIGLSRKVKEDKLTGQVLKTRTGTLRRSIHDEIRGRGLNMVGVVGTNVVYAAPHEYGFDGVVTVREHLRQAKSGLAHTVRQHKRTMHLPVRSFLRSTLTENAALIRTELLEAAGQALAAMAGAK